MAHYAQTVNVIGCIKTTKTDAFFDTDRPAAAALSPRVRHDAAGRYRQPRRMPSLDVAAARTEDGSAVTIGVVNSSDKPQTIQLDVDGVDLAKEAKVWRITGEGDDPRAFNTVDKEQVAIREEASVPFAGSMTVPPYSVSVYRVAIAGDSAP